MGTAALDGARLRQLLDAVELAVQLSQAAQLGRAAWWRRTCQDTQGRLDSPVWTPPASTSDRHDHD